MNSLEKISGLTDNQCRIIDVLLKKGEMTKGDIAKEFGMKPICEGDIGKYPYGDTLQGRVPHG